MTNAEKLNNLSEEINDIFLSLNYDILPDDLCKPVIDALLEVKERVKPLEKLSREAEEEE